LNDAIIRQSFHHKKLRKHHAASDTLVLDELGLQHGRCRADIAVVNGHLVGYEIKSDDDSLNRLAQQVDAYNAVFDNITAVVGTRHLVGVDRMVPGWWGLMIASKGQRGAVHFETVRRATMNLSSDDFSVAQLLWRSEAEEELVKIGFTGKILKQNRSTLYKELIKTLGARKLRKVVRQRLKSRTGWRHPEPPSQCGD
jgi:hypothetical protein